VASNGLLTPDRSVGRPIRPREPRSRHRPRGRSEPAPCIQEKLRLFFNYRTKRRNEPALRSLVHCEGGCAGVKGRDDRQSTAPLTPSVSARRTGKMGRRYYGDPRPCMRQLGQEYPWRSKRRLSPTAPQASPPPFIATPTSHILTTPRRIAARKLYTQRYRKSLILLPGTTHGACPQFRHDE
jgi:hypothetical protein